MFKSFLFIIIFTISSFAISQNEETIESSKINYKEENLEIDVIEKVPIYPGCEGLTDNLELQNCLSNKIQQFVSKKFRVYIVDDLDIPEGIQRIVVTFVINNKGKTVNINAKAYHYDLAKEAIRVIKKLPIMKPGENLGNPVNVRYTLPIEFTIRE